MQKMFDRTDRWRIFVLRINASFFNETNRLASSFFANFSRRILRIARMCLLRLLFAI